MPLITMIGLSGGKIAAIIVSVSKERYEQLMKEAHPIEYPIPAAFFKAYLTKNDVGYEDVDGIYLVTVDNPVSIAIPKELEFFEASDIKALCMKTFLNYTDFIDAYAQHLKSL